MRIHKPFARTHLSRRHQCSTWLLLSLAASGVSAADIYLTPITPSPVDPGDTVTFEISMNFTGEQSVGGLFDVLFDAGALAYQSFTHTGIGGTPNPVPGNGVLADWAVGNFSGLPEVAVIGTVSFTALPGMCGSALVSARDATSSGGGWTGVDFQPQVVDYNPGSIIRRSMPVSNNVKQIRITASDYSPRLQVSEVIALSGGIDVATIANGAAAAGDGTGPVPGTSGGIAHADTAIDGFGPTAWPDIFFPDTSDPSEFLEVTLSFPHNLEGLSIQGSTSASERDIYDVELLDRHGAMVMSCPNQSADNVDNTAVVIPKPYTILLTPLGSSVVNVGDTITFEASIDFTGDPTLGGGIDIIYDPTVLQFVDFAHSGIGLPQFQLAPTQNDGILRGWGAGDFAGLPEVASLGTVSFDVLQPMCGSTALSVQTDNFEVGPWISLNTFTVQEVTYNQPRLLRESMPAIDNVKQIRVTSNIPTWLQITEVVANSGGVDVATLGQGAIAYGDGTGAYPGTTGGPDHADNAIDGIGPTFWPDMFTPDTDSATEFLLVDLAAPTRIDGLTILGRGTINERDIYDVELLDGSGNTALSCFRQSAVNPARKAVVITQSGPDADGDGIEDSMDNCQSVENASQLDSNDDNIGNACDADMNNDCQVNFTDLGALKAAFFSSPGAPGWNADGDFNADESINFTDLGIMKSMFFGPPGPSALGCN